MRPLSVISLLVSFWLIPVNAISQESYIQKRTQEIVASFNKQRYSVKEKYGVRREKYKEVRSEPVIKQNIRDYSGVYEVADLGYLINIQVGSGGKIEPSGYEPKSGKTQKARRFSLENTRIEGALLTATKVYEDETTEKFEGSV